MNGKVAVLAMFGLVSGVSCRELLQANAKNGAALVSNRTEGDLTVHTVQWYVVQNGYPDVYAQCGDVVEFKWANDLHGVGMAVDGDCSKIDERNMFAPPSTMGNVRIMLDESINAVREFGEIYFACSVAQHCARGNQIIAVYVFGCGEEAMMNGSMAPGMREDAMMAPGMREDAMMNGTMAPGMREGMMNGTMAPGMHEEAMMNQAMAPGMPGMSFGMAPTKAIASAG